MTKNTVLAMGRSTRIVEPLSKGLTDGRRLIFSYGEQIPRLDPANLSYWFGGAYAVLLKKLGYAQHLCSPGSGWLPSLDEAVTGRHIFEGTVADLSEFTGALWVKPSEAKVNDLPAGLYTPQHVRDVFDRNDFTEDISLQWTTSVLNINFEHRFFVADGQIIAGSPYLVDGFGYHAGIDTSRMADAAAFAADVLTLGNVPPFFTLDVGLDMDTGAWLVIEGNRAWSSGFYGCEPAAALEVVDASCTYSDDEWQWKPDAHLVKLSATDWTPLRFSDEPIEDSLQFFEFHPH